jgi:hypothetical protein
MSSSTISLTTMPFMGCNNSTAENKKEERPTNEQVQSAKPLNKGF